jgi:hypothetical protein
MSDSIEQVGGLSFPVLLTLLFITLKLCGVIGWSWWWVLSPIPIVFLGLITLFAVLRVTIAIVEAFEKS